MDRPNLSEHNVGRQMGSDGMERLETRRRRFTRYGLAIVLVMLALSRHVMSFGSRAAEVATFQIAAILVIFAGDLALRKKRLLVVRLPVALIIGAVCIYVPELLGGGETGLRPRDTSWALVGLAAVIIIWGLAYAGHLARKQSDSDDQR
jgi:peptidoglycan/LPS O-acetylase OafA/YrhL